MFAAPDAFHGRAVLSFAVHSDGSAWIGTEGVGLYHRETNAWSIFGQSNGLANLFIWSVLETRRGELFVGTWGGGVLVKKGDRFESEGELGKITAPVVSLFEGQQGEVWIGTIAGLYRYEVGKITWSAGKERLVLPDVRAIAQTADGTIWFGMSGGGLGSINKEGVLKQFRKKDGLGSDFVISLHAGTDGTLWIGTSDNGICRLKQGKFTTISTEQGLPSRLISQIVDDGGGNLWMGSHRGILRASKADLNQCADRVLSKIKCLVYGKAEGLTSLICSGGFQPGACQTADRQLWFPTSKGLAIIDPANVTPNAAPPPVIIEDLRLDGESINLPAQSARYSSFAHSNSHSSPLRIPAGRHRFEFQYTALSFAAPDKVRFKYELEGLEKEWTDAGIKRVAQYSYLPPNDYHFRVKACNNDEVWNETGAELAFTVLPLYWQTWWFRALSIFAGAGMLGMGVVWLTRRRIHHRLDQVERQRAVERERARIARDIHDDLGASLTRITMLSQGVRSELAAEPQTAADVDQIYTIARELTRSLDEIVWAVNPKHDTLDSLVTYLGRFAQHFLSAAAIRCRLDVPLHLPAWALTAEIRHNVFLAFKEALHNVIKHARASEVRISMQMLPKGFVLLISDNGCGFDLRLLLDRKPLATDGIRLASGNGLINMQKRLDEVGGRCEWDTAPQEGTRVKLAIVVKT
jgi:signal transduction histidine kinase